MYTTKKNTLPKLRNITKKNKIHIYRLKDPQYKRKLAIDEGINYYKNNTTKKKQLAARKKKSRFNILRLYRKNNDKKGCLKLTNDMKYMDKKYNLGNTHNICGGKKQFLYNPNDPKRSFDVYIDKNPNDTINIKYTTIQDVKNTIIKLEKLYKSKKYPHKRIWQVGMIMKVRLEAMLKHKKTLYPNAKNVKQRYLLANRYFKFLRKRTNLSTFEKRKALTFNF